MVKCQLLFYFGNLPDIYDISVIRDSYNGMWGEGEPVKVVYNEGKPIEKEVSYYPMEMPMVEKKPLPVDVVVGEKEIEEAKAKAEDDYVARNSLYYAPWLGSGIYDPGKDKVVTFDEYRRSYPFKGDTLYDSKSGTALYGDTNNRPFLTYDQFVKGLSRIMDSVGWDYNRDYLMESYINNFPDEYKNRREPSKSKVKQNVKAPLYGEGGHLFQGGGDKNKIYTVTGKTATVKARKPDWQRGLTDYDWARARKYYPDGNGMVSDKGIEWLKHISKKRGGRNSGNEYLYAALRNVRDFYENDVIPRAQRYRQSYESQDNFNRKINNLKTVVSNLQPSNYIYKDLDQKSGMFNPLTGHIYLKNKPNPELYFSPYGYTIQQGPLISHEDTHLEQYLNYPNYLNEREEYLLEKAYPYTEGVSKMYGFLAPIKKNKERQAVNRELRHELFNEDKLFIDYQFDSNNFDERIKNGKFDDMIKDFIKYNYYFGRGKNYKPTKKDLDNVKEALLEVANNQNDLSNSYSNIMRYGGHLYQDGGNALTKSISNYIGSGKSFDDILKENAMFARNFSPEQIDYARKWYYKPKRIKRNDSPTKEKSEFYEDKTASHISTYKANKINHNYDIPYIYSKVISLETVGEDDLEDVAFLDVVLGLFDHRAIALLVEKGPDF